MKNWDQHAVVLVRIGTKRPVWVCLSSFRFYWLIGSIFLFQKFLFNVKLRDTDFTLKRAKWRQSPDFVCLEVRLQFTVFYPWELTIPFLHFFFRLCLLFSQLQHHHKTAARPLFFSIRQFFFFHPDIMRWNNQISVDPIDLQAFCLNHFLCVIFYLQFILALYLHVFLWVGYKSHCWAVPPSLDCRA